MKAGSLITWAIVLYWAMPYLLFTFMSLFFFFLISIGAS